MKTLAFSLAFTWSLMLSAFKKSDCPPHFDLGMTYREIQSGPCPDIEKQAAFKAEDGFHVGYYCPSKGVMVVGDMRTGKMDAFFLFQTAKQ